MARVLHPWHTLALDYYHDNNACSAFKRTPQSQRIFGTGGTRHCPECASLNQSDTTTPALDPDDPKKPR